MNQMNPYYARHSQVGPVFDVARWNSRFAFLTILVGLGIFLFFAAAGYLFHNPIPLVKADATALKELHGEILKFKKAYPQAVAPIMAGVGMVIYFGLAATVFSIVDFLNPNFYLRVGPGGISLRVPQGIDLRKFGMVSKKLELDLGWSEISDWKVTQKKQFGSLSPNSGNISADLIINLVDGKRHWIDLNIFKENGRIIWERMGEAAEMTPMQFDQALAPSPADDFNAVRETSGFEEKRIAIEASLTRQLYTTPGSVVLSDGDSDKFVQFSVGNGSIELDLPVQILNEIELLRAGDFFAERGRQLVESELFDRPGGTVVGVQKSFTLELDNDVEQAATLALAIFHDVYQAPDDFQLTLEEL